MRKSDDPRLSDDYVRQISSNGSVVLIGVVHDHPASKYRVRTIVGEVDPDVLALELPPLSVPLFERYAESSETPPLFGGEMSTAVQAASTDRVVGIDGPTAQFAARLGQNLYTNDAALATVRSVSRSLASVTKRAATCRLAAALTGLTGVRLQVDSPVAHECNWRDDPRRQAEDERGQIRQAKSIMNAFEPTKAARFRKETREAYMADRLSALRREGKVVAVVGVDHLDPLATSLTNTPTEA